MNDPKNRVTCSVHGTQDETFVCAHIVETLHTGKAVGFHWPRESAGDPRPDAWCTQCENKRVAGGGEWTEEVMEFVDMKVLCGACYDRAKDIWQTGRALWQ
jgi:hypothetical protein